MSADDSTRAHQIYNRSRAMDGITPAVLPEYWPLVDTIVESHDVSHPLLTKLCVSNLARGIAYEIQTANREHWRTYSVARTPVPVDTRWATGYNPDDPMDLNRLNVLQSDAPYDRTPMQHIDQLDEVIATKLADVHRCQVWAARLCDRGEPESGPRSASRPTEVFAYARGHYICVAKVCASCMEMFLADDHELSGRSIGRLDFFLDDYEEGEYPCSAVDDPGFHGEDDSWG